MIINVRGTSGSGKTYAVRYALDQMKDFQTITNNKGKIIANVAYLNMNPVYVLGDYTKNECGGCDGIKTQDEICSLVRHFSEFGHVIFEGLLISGMFARYASLNNEFSYLNEHYIWAFLDTPIETCLERVQQRRDARGDTRPFNPDNTIGKYDAVWKCWDKATKAGYECVKLYHKGDAAGVKILELLESDLWEFGIIKESFR